MSPGTGPAAVVPQSVYGTAARVMSREFLPKPQRQSFSGEPASGGTECITEYPGPAGNPSPRSSLLVSRAQGLTFHHQSSGPWELATGTGLGGRGVIRVVLAEQAALWALSSRLKSVLADPFEGN